MWVAWPFLVAIVYGIFLYYVTKPIKRKLQPYIKNDNLLVATCMILLVLPLILLIGYTLLMAVNQFNGLVQSAGFQSLPQGPLSNMSTMVTSISSGISVKDIMSGDFTSITQAAWYRTFSGYSGSISGLLVSTGMTIMDILFKVFLMIIIAFYLLRDDDKIIDWFNKTFPDVENEHDHMLLRYARAVDEDLEKIFFGNILSIIFFAIIAAVTFELLNVFAPDVNLLIPSPVLLGILCGAAALIPMVGMYIVTVPMFLYILVQLIMSGTLVANAPYFVFMVVAVVLIVQTLPDFVLRPFIARGKINTGLLMFAYILGPIVFGIAGLFLGAIVLVLLTHYFRIVVPQLTKDNKFLVER
jgi:predicted PurR-regulated permease PerM